MWRNLIWSLLLLSVTQAGLAEERFVTQEVMSGFLNSPRMVRIYLPLPTGWSPIVDTLCFISTMAKTSSVPPGLTSALAGAVGAWTKRWMNFAGPEEYRRSFWSAWITPLHVTPNAADGTVQAARMATRNLKTTPHFCSGNSNPRSTRITAPDPNQRTQE